MLLCTGDAVEVLGWTGRYGWTSMGVHSTTSISKQICSIFLGVSTNGGSPKMWMLYTGNMDGFLMENASRNLDVLGVPIFQV